MKHNVSHFVTRLFIIFLWVVVIIAFLYVGHFVELLRDKKSINVLAWGQVLDKEFLGKFEKETGIRVNLSYFERNEELFVKLKTSQDHGYDLIMPSDYAVELLIQENLIKKIDQNKLEFWSDLYPELLDHYFDPNNQYSIPYYWTLYGIGIDTDYYNGKMPPITWDLAFSKEKAPERISVIDDPRELILVAALYLYGSIENLTAEKIDNIKQLLKKQKKWVEIYTDLRSEYALASKTVPVAIILAADLLKVMRRFDNIEFFIPKDGAFVVIDSFAIPTASKKDELIYAFLNYLYRLEVLQKYVNKFDFFSAHEKVIITDGRFMKFARPTSKVFKKIYFFKNVLSEDVMNQIWIELKS